MAKGLSQTELADALGVTFQQVQKYEKGINRVKSITWDTVLGPLSFNKKGDITAIGWAVYRWDQNGNYDEITRRVADLRNTRQIFFWSPAAP